MNPRPLAVVDQALDADDVTQAPLIPRIDDPINALVDSVVMIVLKVLGKDMAQLSFR